MSVYSSVRRSVRQYLHISCQYVPRQSERPSVPSPVHPPVHPSDRPTVRPFAGLYVFPSIRLSVRRFVRPAVRQSVRQPSLAIRSTIIIVSIYEGKQHKRIPVYRVLGVSQAKGYQIAVTSYRLPTRRCRLANLLPAIGYRLPVTD